MTDAVALPLALVLLAATLVIALVRPRRVPEAAAAACGALLLVIVGAISVAGAGRALQALGPTLGFLAALLLIAEGCRREGLFTALGQLMARGSRGDGAACSHSCSPPRRR